MNPPIVPADMRKHYNSATYWSGTYSDYLGGETVRLRNGRARMARAARNLPGRGYWLDIGCATGSFTAVVRDSGYTVIGIDPAEEMVRFGRLRYGLDLRATTIEEFDAAANSFDVVSFWGTDSHFYDVREAFSKIVRLLKPGGHLIFSYQDYDHWIRRLFPGIKRNINVYHNLTQRSLRLFLPQLGMSLVSETTEVQVTQVRHITTTLGVGKKLLARWETAQVKVPTLSYYAVVAKKL